MIRAIYAIIVLDLKRAWLDRARLMAGLAQPLLYLFVLGAGLGGASRMGGSDYRRNILFPGVLSLSLLFPAMFAAIGIVFDRQIGFFKAVLVAPLPRSAIAIGKVLAGALQAFAQGVILLPFAPLAGVPLSLGTVIQLLFTMLFAAIAFASMGVAVASRFKSTTVFPIISNTMLLPMFFLSGALYPLKDAPRWMQIATQLDPVAYAVDLMRGPISGSYFFAPKQSIAFLACFIVVLGYMAVRVFNKGEDDSSLGASRFNWRR